MPTATKTRSKSTPKGKVRVVRTPKPAPRKAAVPETQDQAAAKEAAVDRPPFKVWRAALGEQLHMSGSMITPLNDLLYRLYDAGLSPEQALQSLKGEHAETVKGVVAKATPKAARSAPAKSGEALYDLPVANVHRNAFNPRQTTYAGADVQDDELQQLAESIKREGLLQPIEVRADAFQPGHYEIIAGERRWMAHKLLRAQTIRCVIVDVTDEEAKSHCVEENLRRKDLNPIERARSLQLLVDIGLTQAAVAKRVGYANASQVTNELAMLKLDADWQKLIADGGIPATHTRFLTGWRHRESVMKCALSLYQAKVKQTGHVTQRDFERLVDDAVRKCSRSMAHGNWYDACPFKPTDEQRALLDIESVPNAHGGDPEPRAFDTTLWKRLAKAAEEKAEQKRAADAAQPKTDQPAAEAKPKGPDEWRVKEVLAGWLTARIGETVGKLKGDAALKAFLVLSTDAELAYEMTERLINAKKVKKEGDIVRQLFRMPSGELLKRLPEIMADALAGETAYHGTLNLRWPDLWALGEALGIDYGTWRPDADTFSIYSPEMLVEIATSAGFPPSDDDTRDSVQAELADKWPKGDFPPGFEPKAVAKFN